MKILHLDVETAPNLATVWAIFKQNIGINQLLETSRVICFSAQWEDSDNIVFLSEFHNGRRVMLKTLHRLLTAADAVVTYNGEGFDLPTINREFLMAKMPPPMPYKSIDLIRTIRKQFRFVSNKLDHVCKELGIGRKVQHKGHELWLECMDNKPEAWETMRTYNMQDVVILKELYGKVLPWIEQHPAHGLYINSDEPKCRNCGSENLVKEGKAYTQLGVYQQYRCKDCGRWGRGRKSEKFVEVR